MARAHRLCAAVAVALLIGGCGTGNKGGTSPTVGGPTPSATGSTSDLTQIDYVEHIREDQQALDRGQLLYTDPGVVHPGDELTFRITVVDLGKATKPAQPATVPSGLMASPENVPTGGDVGVSLSCAGVACTPYDNPRQPVVGEGSSAGWSFGVHADSAGEAHLHITARVYLTSTDQVLSEAVPIDVTFQVRRTWSYTFSQAVSWLFTTAPGLGLFSGGAAATTVGGVLGRAWARRRRPEAERVLAAIPRGEEFDRLLFGVLHASGRPVREVAGLRVADLAVERRAVSLTFPTRVGGARIALISDRRTVRLLRARAASVSDGGRIFDLDGEQLTTAEAERRWRAHCARLGLDLPLGSLRA